MGQSVCIFNSREAFYKTKMFIYQCQMSLNDALFFCTQLSQIFLKTQLKEKIGLYSTTSDFSPLSYN
jgi:hypothetical protein